MGFVIDREFYPGNKWVSALTAHLVRALVEEFKPIIIHSQEEYDCCKKGLHAIISMEPKWAAPMIRYDPQVEHRIGVFVSDPHNKTAWLERYCAQNEIDWVFSYYYHPFFYHFPRFPRERFVHVPWAIPDSWIGREKLRVCSPEIVIFGGKEGDSYDVRNWCRIQQGVRNFDNSGVENKTMAELEYFAWLRRFDAIIAAGSSDPKYDLVTPKYFEIAAAGALLIGQACRDLSLLGFDETNMVGFDQDTFAWVVKEYRSNPNAYLPVRERGRQLIAQRHKISDRVRQIRSLFSSGVADMRSAGGSEGHCRAF
jgi:hypothetical protein